MHTSHAGHQLTKSGYRLGTHAVWCTHETKHYLNISHCITWFQTQLILATCQIRYHNHCGIIVALDSSEP